MFRGVTCVLRRGFAAAAGPYRASLPCRGLEEFVDQLTPKGEVPIAGRSWTVMELRQKSFSDLHKLWWVLYKEKNMLLTEKLVARRKVVGDIKAPDRIRKVSRSMKAIRHVVEERETNRQRLAAKHKFDTVRAAALARGAAPDNAPDVKAARKAQQQLHERYTRTEASIKQQLAERAQQSISSSSDTDTLKASATTSQQQQQQ